MLVAFVAHPFLCGAPLLVPWHEGSHFRRSKPVRCIGSRHGIIPVAAGWLHVPIHSCRLVVRTAGALCLACEQYIAGGSRAEAACSIYIWTVEGHLVTRLEGPNLGLLSLTRHPVRPFVAAALTNGKVTISVDTLPCNACRAGVVVVVAFTYGFVPTVFYVLPSPHSLCDL